MADVVEMFAGVYLMLAALTLAMFASAVSRDEDVGVGRYAIIFLFWPVFYAMLFRITYAKVRRWLRKRT